MSVGFLVLALGALVVATAQPTTTGTRFEGFSYAGNVIGYVNMTMDYCDIKAAMAAGNFTEALSIYSTGKNSFSGLARRTFFRFASYITANGSVEPLHDSILAGKDTSSLDAAIRAALADGKATLAAGLIQVGTLKYHLHEVDEAYNKIKTYLADGTGNLTNLVSDASGAPHNVDEAWALWAGGAANNCGTLSGWASSLGAAMGTTFLGKSYVNTAMINTVNEMLAAARLSTLNIQAYDAARTNEVRLLTLLGLQGVSVAAYTADAAAACKRPAAEVEDAKTMIAVHWAYLEPMLKLRNFKASAVTELHHQLTASKLSYKKVAAAVKGVLSAMGRRSSELGAPQSAIIAANWKCSSKTLRSIA
ncbi:hypothetical protein CHLRE_12g546550v5 [Chlamydomonas reinhardtii]|uniref:Fe-assimilating protein 1 n=1 Tax=Chlamydomonas reinhardtii TaxID=3055 RepID=Q9LD42_CHLRE|nr:uncharacterized protein CHLRE_12g546550v5 [Chlamydomonas reinhardtii]ABS32019.1 Fe-assimilating protein 1 [Chlamydomonas reinhardtii]PNW76133.1 hypothetical protein CHLRE_12g546550v5 [Chlamydomonas reinhardtii]BAA94959.1 high-CO2 inducible, periplasmic protein [Chlamydomonas reinhardtii]BAA94960.1 high-CO2 inducible, periplasmic protein [Chlamydomonas reinhardtii]|eukprot:XP_001693964.1 Fe-assimilating protein 1 [Chlamydomonas reinhardtii]